MSENDPKHTDEKKSSTIEVNAISSKKDEWVSAWEKLNPEAERHEDPSISFQEPIEEFNEAKLADEGGRLSISITS